jgi:hypothetical protein
MRVREEGWRNQPTEHESGQIVQIRQIFVPARGSLIGFQIPQADPVHLHPFEAGSDPASIAVVKT